MFKKNKAMIEGNLKIEPVNEIKTALSKPIIARTINHFLPETSSSLAR